MKDVGKKIGGRPATHRCPRCGGLGIGVTLAGRPGPWSDDDNRATCNDCGWRGTAGHAYLMSALMTAVAKLTAKNDNLGTPP